MTLKNVMDGATHSPRNVQGMKLPMGSFELYNTLLSLHTMMEEIAYWCEPEGGHKQADDILCRVIALLLQRTYDDERYEVESLLESYRKMEKWYA